MSSPSEGARGWSVINTQYETPAREQILLMILVLISLKTDLRFARPKIRGSTKGERRSDENCQSAFRPLCILQ